jgi:hypothetical protein
VYRLRWLGVQENIFAPAGMGFLQAVAMYDAGFVGFRRTVSPVSSVSVGVLVGVATGDEVLGGLALTHSPVGATADVGFFGGFGGWTMKV